MELRVLRYYLAICREESVSKAAEVLHITQPTLSRQIMELEAELKTKLIIRGNKSRRIQLTEDGVRLKKRAKEIIALADKTENEFVIDDPEISGDIDIGAGETVAMKMVASTASKLKKEYPNIHYHLYSGNADEVSEKLDKGLLDFGVFIGLVDLEKYSYLRFPVTDRWGILMPSNHPLAQKEWVEIQDLLDLPLLVSVQSMIGNELSGWSRKDFEELNIVGTYNLVFNASWFVEEGYACAWCLEDLVDTTANANLCFRPLKPELSARLVIAWKKHQILSKPAKLFIDTLQTEFERFVS